jgi:hypothetical protein
MAKTKQTKTGQVAARSAPKAGTKAKSAPGKAAKPGARARLRPGELDGLVLSFMCEREKELPMSPSAIAKGIGRSSGAVGNCLDRLAKGKQARLASKAPRKYDLKGVKAR